MVCLSKRFTTAGRTDWVAPNLLVMHLNRAMVIDAVQLEEFHHSLKQLMGSEKCEVV